MGLSSLNFQRVCGVTNHALSGIRIRETNLGKKLLEKADLSSEELERVCRAAKQLIQGKKTKFTQRGAGKQRACSIRAEMCISTSLQNRSKVIWPETQYSC